MRIPPSTLHPATFRPRLDVRDLQVVLALATTGSTAAAASKLHITQSAVSRALLLAEGKLGVRLFERTVRGLVPTPQGTRLISGAGPVLAQLTELETRVSSPTDTLTRVRLVCECYTAYRWLPSVLTGLRRVLPNVEVSLEVDHTNEPVPALLEGEIDVALLTTSPVRAPLQEQPLFSDEIVFVVSPSHPLAARPAISTADLRQTPLIGATTTPPPETRWFFRKVFGRATPKLHFLRFPLTEAVMDAARAGMGIAVMSEWIAAPYLGGGDLVVKRLTSGPLHRPWRIAFRPEATEAARLLATALEGAAPRLAAEGRSTSSSSRGRLTRSGLAT